MTTWGIVLAAGRGTRYGAPKHAQVLDGRPLWEHSHRTLTSVTAIDGVVVVGDMEGAVAGGARRRDSVRAGLGALPADVEWVLVHDGARPLVSVAMIERVLGARRQGVDGVVPAVAVTDTVKRVSDGIVTSTIDRSELVAVQTPQAFRVAVLRRAHEMIDDDATDDAALVERLGGTVAVVEGDPENIKVTYRGDLAIVKTILLGRSDHG